MRPPHEAPLSTFRIDSDTVSALTASLRSDASALAPLPPGAPPAAGPLRSFAEAFAAAVTSVNGRTEDLRSEAQRLADVMDATAAAAHAVDARSGRAFTSGAGVSLP